MHHRFSLLPAPYTRAGSALADCRRLLGIVFAFAGLGLGWLIYWLAFAVGGVAALSAILALLAFGAAFLGLCAAAGLLIWGGLRLSRSVRVFSRYFASWAGI